MKAYYFPAGFECFNEALFVNGKCVIGRLREEYGIDCSLETLKSSQEFVAQNRNKLKKQSLMKLVQVSVDLVRELKECVSSRNFHFSKLIAMQLLQSARGYGEAR